MAGQKINDFGGYPHTSDMAMASKTKLKPYSPAEGAGAVGKYEDTAEAIKSTQSAGSAKVSGHKMKDGYRY